MDYDICVNCIHVSVCKYSLEVKKMIEAIDNALTDRVIDFEVPYKSVPGPVTRCVVKYPLKFKAECGLFKAKIVCRSKEGERDDDRSR